MQSEILILLALALFMTASLEIGFRIGHFFAGKEQNTGPVGAIQGATLGLLGLLLGFSFGGAASRFMERQSLIVEEANAIGTAYLRADLLDAPQSDALRNAFSEYVGHQLKASESLRYGVTQEMQTEVARLHDIIWKTASEGAQNKPETLLAVLNPVNEVIDLYSTRLAASKKHLPKLIMGLLIACAGLSIFVLGLGCGLGGKRHLLMTMPMLLLVSATLWATIDLDYPRAGWIQLSDAPLRALYASMTK